MRNIKELYTYLTYLLLYFELKLQYEIEHSVNP